MVTKVKAEVYSVNSRLVGRVSRVSISKKERNNIFLVLDDADNIGDIDTDGYAGLITKEACKNISKKNLPLIFLESIPQDKSIIAVNPSGSVFTLYDSSSISNCLFVTSACNSNCLMCPQPPSGDKVDSLLDEINIIIDLIDTPPASLGISGGEPLLLGDGFIDIIKKLKEKMPETAVHVLTNGRILADKQITQRISAIGHENLSFGIPLFADNSKDHDYIVQAKGAFNQTVNGLLNSARYGLKVEIRTVLHKQTIPRLEKFCEYIYRNFPFVFHVAFMGMEHMGYVKKNITSLWIDPVDFSKSLEESIRYLHYRGVNVSIYNLPLCVISSKLWQFSRKSISDYKNIYLEECSNCDAVNFCGGLFKSSEVVHSRGIKSIALTQGSLDKISRFC